MRRPLELDGCERLRDHRRCHAARACAAFPISRISISPSAPWRASIQQKCIQCNLCYVACNDTAHQCIDLIDADGHAVAPYSYAVSSNGKQEATATRPQPARARRRLRRMPPLLQRLPGGSLHRDGGGPSGREPVTWDQLVEIAARGHRGLGGDGRVSRRRRAFDVH